jgi:hypothetical protein
MTKKAQKRGRTPKSDAIKGDLEPEIIVEEAPPAPSVRLRAPVDVERPKTEEITPVESTVEVKTDAQTISMFDESPALPEKDPLSPDQDLTEAQKAEFKKLLDKKMSLEKRADQLVKLAGFSDTKRAPVALRAIEVINKITGVTDDTANEAPSMFNLPEGVHVRIDVETPEK